MTETNDVRAALESARTIVAYTDSAGGAVHVRRTALEAADRSGARVILYPLDAASPFSKAVPGEWAAEGERQEYGNPMSAEDLELLGQGDLAAQVREAGGGGVEVGGWLPEDTGLPAMASYAEGHDHAVILLPAGHEAPNLVERVLAGDRDAPEVDEQEPIPVLEVDEAGRVRGASRGA